MADKDLRTQGTEDSIEGKKDKLKGRMKDAVGGLTNDPGKQAEGKWDKFKGSAKDKLGKVERDIGHDEHKADVGREDMDEYDDVDVDRDL